MAIETLQLRVRQITNEAEGINTFELVDPSGRELPEFSAGSHIDIHIPFHEPVPSIEALPGTKGAGTPAIRDDTEKMPRSFYQ